MIEINTFAKEMYKTWVRLGHIL